jgi:hypothetical protein
MDACTRLEVMAQDLRQGRPNGGWRQLPTEAIGELPVPDRTRGLALGVGDLLQERADGQRAADIIVLAADQSAARPRARAPQSATGATRPPVR